MTTLIINSKEPRDVDLPSPVGDDEAKIFSGPTSLDERDGWRNKLNLWRINAKQTLSCDDKAYLNGTFANQTHYNAAVIWLWDELLFDFKKQVFTPERLIEDAKRFGGFDHIILWHAYPVIGIDSRNQFDYYNQIPGLGSLISDLQRAGIKVHLNYNPWDRWTSRGPNEDQIEIANLILKFGFDGLFLDTMKSADPNFMAPIIEVKPDLIIGGESRVPQERICDHVMSWAQWFADSSIPGVIRAKWFERRHMLHQTRRWNRSHREEMQIAWLNGAGMLIWEVVFGSWVGWDQQQVNMWREMVNVLRENHALITTGEWEPLTKLADDAEAAGLFASKFSNDENALYTIINKSNEDYVGEIAFGLVGLVPAQGVAAISKSATQTHLTKFTYHEKSNEFPHRRNQRTKFLAGDVQEFEITYRNRECSLYAKTAFIDAWKPLPPHYHQIFTEKVSAPARKGILDKYEVSNRDFFKFIQATNYIPKSSHRFLAHWINGSPSSEQNDLPVTYVNLDDARAFAHWRGTEIPTEWEWQLNFDQMQRKMPHYWNLTDSEQSDGRTRFLILKGGADYNIRNGQGAKSTSGIAESDWYVDGGVRDERWVEKLLIMGFGMSRSENITFRCFTPG